MYDPITSNLTPCLDSEADTPGQLGSRDEKAEAVAADEAVAEEEEELSRGSQTPSGDGQSSRLRNVFVNLPTSTLVHPRSVFQRTDDLAGSEGFAPPAPLATEWDAIQSLLGADPSQKDDDFIQFELDDFTCYVDIPLYPFEMRALHDHATRTGDQHFYFDGVLRIGDVQHYVHKVRFDQIPLGNYGKDPETGRHHPSVGDQLWVLSRLNETKNKFHGQASRGTDIYYQLKNPATEYARFHNAFLWVADLAKHVVDFCEYKIESGSNVSIHHFREDFARWLRKTHRQSPHFLKWYKQRSCDDFRQSVVAHEPFIRKETFGVLAGKARHIHLFREIAAPFNIYKRVGWAATKKDPKNYKIVPQTIVTPYIYECFSRLHLAQLLKPVEPSISTEEAIKRSWPNNTSKQRAFTRSSEGCNLKGRKAMTNSIQPGDLISTPPDAKDSGTRWLTDSKDKKWFGLVQGVCKTKKGERFFDVIWLYQPDDTPCCSMKYPWDKELFLGNHCTCDQNMRSKIGEDQVIGVHSVEWFGDPGTCADFFVRQTYLSEERRFVTLENAHLKCEHNRDDHQPLPKYLAGDTVLVLEPGTAVLEPHELLGFLDDGVARLRRLRRRREWTSDCPPNELVYTEEETHALVEALASKCIVRFYSPGETVPAPYNRNGTGNAFFITNRLLDDGSLQPLGSDRPQLRQGFDPKKREEKLRALDLFCGFGNFGRGLEDGGAVKAKWANDIWETAIHTYMANTEPGHDSMKPFLGSIDDLLHHALEGKFSASVPRPGKVDAIFGGSPCPGFSLITTDKTTLTQIKNRSLVASFASCIDFWRPRWGILENVKTIVQSSKNRTEDFFSQLICALVGMGYQAQIVLGDAWSHGDPQSRVRAFLCFAAPGVKLPERPYPSHSNPRHVMSGGLGKMSNGEPYVTRTYIPTAFRHVTAGEATADLPDIYDGKPDTCIPFPDHRLSISISSGDQQRRTEGEGKNRRAQVLNIPTRPYGVNFAKAWYGPGAKGVAGEADMFPHERDAFPSSHVHRTARTSKGWSRAHPHKLFSTVTTYCHITDARTGGNLLHWDQPRPLTVMEVRRAQGVPDDEVLCGSPRDQWEMVGNGVARGISVALGLSLREAWRGSLFEDAPPVEADMSMAAVGEVEEGSGGRACLDAPWEAGGGKEADEQHEDTVMLEREPPAIYEGDGVVIISDTSRGSSCTPARLPSTTPLTSRSTTDASCDGTGAPGKRPLPGGVLAGELPSASKRPRYHEEDPDDVSPTTTFNGATVVRMSSAELEGDLHLL